MPKTKSSIGAGARSRIRTTIVSPVWNTCRASPSGPRNATSVISTSRDPHRPSMARNHSLHPDPPTPPPPFDGSKHVAGRRCRIDRRLGKRCRRRFRRCRGRLPGFGVDGGELPLFVVLDVGDVGADYALRSAVALDAAAIQQQSLVAKALDQPERVRHEEDRIAAELE